MIDPSQITNPFSNWVKNTLPSVYDEQYSFYELLNKVLETLGLCINSNNVNATAIIQVQNLYNELKLYVDNYFTDLNVQTEINTKLDLMATNGTLTSILTDYLELSSLLIYNNIVDLKNATNLINNTTVEILGYNEINDGGKAKYKIRTITDTDTIDEINIIELNNPLLIGELINENNIKTFNSISDLKNAINLINNTIVETNGFHEVNDGGKAKYYIRLKTIQDITNDINLIELDNELLVAELINEYVVNVKQYGAVGDGVTDDTNALKAAFNKLRVYPRASKDISKLYFPDGIYIVSDTLSITNGRFIQISGSGIIQANMNKPIITITSSMWLYIDGINLLNEHEGSSSGCISIESSYILKFSNLYCEGGDKAINVIYGNNIIIDSCSLRNARINLYTTSMGNNASNIVTNCAIEGSKEYELYFGFTGPYYGPWKISNCYIEGNQHSNGLIYITNGFNVTFDNCYINQTIDNGYIVIIDGTLSTMNCYFLKCNFNGSGGNAYAFRQISASIIKGPKLDISNELSSGVTLYNEEDTYIPKLLSLIPKELNNYNLKTLLDNTGVLNNWLGSGTYTLTDPVDEECLKTINISDGYIYYPIYLKKDNIYDFKVKAKNDGVGSAIMQLYKTDLGTSLGVIETNNTSYTNLILTVIPTEDSLYYLLLRNNDTTIASFSGVKVYNYVFSI